MGASRDLSVLKLPLPGVPLSLLLPSLLLVGVTALSVGSWWSGEAVVCRLEVEASTPITSLVVFTTCF